MLSASMLHRLRCNSLKGASIIHAVTRLYHITARGIGDLFKIRGVLWESGRRSI